LGLGINQKVKKKAKKKAKHIPQRTCVGCREIQPKRSLIRIVRSADGIRIDPTGKVAGRGAYLHDNPQCWTTALKGSLANALKVEFSDQDKAILTNFMITLPALSEGTEELPTNK
jgi:uncharacterized protein